MTVGALPGLHVWERVWQRPLEAQRDDRHLRREERNPRWALVQNALAATFGGLAGRRTIELGSGRGDLSALLAARGAHATLVDYCTAALAQAQARFARLKLDAEFAHADLLGSLETFAGRFDVASSLGVVEHFAGQERRRALAAHYHVLRPGGVAVVSVPYAWGVPYRLWKVALEVRHRWPYGMEIPYGRRELRTLALAAGFTRVETHVTGFWQSLGDHWLRSLIGRSPDWVARRSRLDAYLGGTLTLLAWK
jgi:SAM-dependent methyltransferase